jgi:hypothetical protein
VLINVKDEGFNMADPIVGSITQSFGERGHSTVTIRGVEDLHRHDLILSGDDSTQEVNVAIAAGQLVSQRTDPGHAGRQRLRQARQPSAPPFLTAPLRLGLRGLLHTAIPHDDTRPVYYPRSPSSSEWPGWALWLTPREDCRGGGGAWRTNRP